jgi:hypothetical protein
MKVFLLIFVCFLSGCAQWNGLSDGEKTGIIVGGAILVGANIIKNSEDPVNNCISTRSIKTGCPGY